MVKVMITMACAMGYTIITVPFPNNPRVPRVRPRCTMGESMAHTHGTRRGHPQQTYTPWSTPWPMPCGEQRVYGVHHEALWQTSVRTMVNQGWFHGPSHGLSNYS